MPQRTQPVCVCFFFWEFVVVPSFGRAIEKRDKPYEWLTIDYHGLAWRCWIRTEVDSRSIYVVESSRVLPVPYIYDIDIIEVLAQVYEDTNTILDIYIRI